MAKKKKQSKMWNTVEGFIYLILLGSVFWIAFGWLRDLFSDIYLFSGLVVILIIWSILFKKNVISDFMNKA